MPNIRRTFIKGVMNKDVDERLLDDGYFRHAENIVINTSENSDVGAIEKCLSNKQLTYFDFGDNVETLGSYSDQTKSKLYWWIISDKGCYLLEYDVASKILYTVLADTRRDKVLNLKNRYLITGITKIISEKPGNDLLLWTDNNIEICCINIERAKKYGENGFDKEDIYLIKKPPLLAPRTVMTFNGSEANNIEDKFICFGYRYKYLDGEYSALSPLSNYCFEPKGLNIDFDTNDNIGMVNRYNAVMVYFDTGDKRVKEIQVLAKDSNSNTVYVVETFNKEKESWGNNTEKNILYSNNKLYVALPEKELFKQYDAIPRRASSLTAISNRLVVGNYTEGYDLKDKSGSEIKVDFKASVTSEQIEENLFLEYRVDNNILFLDQTDGLHKNSLLNFNIDFVTHKFGEDRVSFKFSGNLDLLLDKNYSNFNDLVTSELFINYLDEFNKLIKQDLVTVTDEKVVIKSFPVLAAYGGRDSRVILHAMSYDINSVDQSGFSDFTDATDVSLFRRGKGRSLKSNKDYELAIIYEDEYKRSSTALTSLNNTVHIPISKSDSINKMKIEINNKAPYWAKTFRIAVKSSALNYETIVVSKFYTDGVFTWCKLEGNSKDKVKEGDTLILKKDSTKVQSYIIETEVLEKKAQEKDFIKGNKDDQGNDIIEEEGTYIKIKPVGFSMNENNFKIHKKEASDSVKGSGNKPYVNLYIFKDDDKAIKLPVGSSVYLWIKSTNKPDRGWQENTFEKTWNINLKDYTLDKWYTDHIDNKPLWGTIGNAVDNYQGFITRQGDNLRVTGTKSGMSGGRYGYLDAKIIVRVNEGYYVFETTKSKNDAIDIFYKTSETFKIENGYHIGNVSNQTDVSAAVIDLDFFNCYSIGNGLESFKIKDSFNANWLNIDLGPTSTSTEEYSEVVRYADLTYSEQFVESVGLNGLNSFNNSLLNWRELDKQNGAILKILGQEGNLLVFQKDKIGQVLFGKDALYNADGTSNISKVPYVLGEYIPYAGEFGMTHPESFEKDGNRTYWVDAKRGYVLRLSNNGISPITYGMEGWFKNALNNRYNAKIIGGIDPYCGLYNLSIGDNPDVPLVVDCGFILNRYAVNEPFKYEFKTNDIKGYTTISYIVTDGAITIECVYLGKNYVKSNVSTSGEIVIETLDSSEHIFITVSPVTDVSSYNVTHTCPVGDSLDIITIVLADKTSYNRNVSSSYKWGNSQLYSTANMFDNEEVVLFEKETGIESIGKYPQSNRNVYMQAKEDGVSLFNPDWNSLYYLVAPEELTDVSEILENAKELKVSSIQNSLFPTYQGEFEFKRNLNEKLYMIWDCRFKGGILPKPMVSYNTNPNESFILNVVSDLKYPFVDNVEVIYKEIESDDWTSEYITKVNEGETNINLNIPFENISLEKDYEFKCRFKSYQNEYSDYTTTKVESKYKVIPKPIDVGYTLLESNDKVKLEYSSDSMFTDIISHSEVIFKKVDSTDFGSPIINKEFVSKNKQTTYIEIEKYEDYDIKVRFVSRDNNLSEYSEVKVKGAEKPIEPNTEE